MAKTHEELDEIYLYMELGKLGKVSNKTLLEKAGLDYEKEKNQIKKEKNDGIFPIVPSPTNNNVTIPVNIDNGTEIVEEDDEEENK